MTVGVGVGLADAALGRGALGATGICGELSRAAAELLIVGRLRGLEARGDRARHGLDVY